MVEIALKFKAIFGVSSDINIAVLHLSLSDKRLFLLLIIYC